MRTFRITGDYFVPHSTYHVGTAVCWVAVTVCIMTHDVASHPPVEWLPLPPAGLSPEGRDDVLFAFRAWTVAGTPWMFASWITGSITKWLEGRKRLWTELTYFGHAGFFLLNVDILKFSLDIHTKATLSGSLKCNGFWGAFSCLLCVEWLCASQLTCPKGLFGCKNKATHTQKPHRITKQC